MLWNSEALAEGPARQVVFCRTEECGEAAQAFLPKLCVVALNGGALDQEIDSRFHGRRVVVLDPSLVADNPASSPGDEFSVSVLARLFHAAGVAELKAWPLDPAEASEWTVADISAHAKANAWIISAPQQDAVQSEPEPQDAAKQQPTAEGEDSSPVAALPSLSDAPVPRPSASEYDSYEYVPAPGLDLSMVYSADDAEVSPEPVDAAAGVLASLVADLDKLDDGGFYTAWMYVSEKTKGDMPADVRARLIARFRKASGRDAKYAPLGKLPTEEKLAQNRYGTAEIEDPDGWQDPDDVFYGEQLPAWNPDWMPPEISDFIEDQSVLLGVDPGMLGHWCLGVLSGVTSHAITLRVRAGQGWYESPRLWICIVADSGSLKTPVYRAAMKPLGELAFRVTQESMVAYQAYEREKAIYDAQMAEYVRRRAKGELGIEPPEPLERAFRKTVYVKDSTPEGLAEVLEGCGERGIGSYHDELAGWFLAPGRYSKAGGGTERAGMLELYEGGPHPIHRAGGRVLNIQNYSAAVCGGIQRHKLRMMADQIALESDGLAQRFIWYCATEHEGRQIAAVRSAMRQDEVASEAWSRIVNACYALRKPVQPVVMSPSAQNSFRAFEEWCIAAKSSEDITAGTRQAISKLPGVTARTALLHHCVEAAAAGLDVPGWELTEATVERVISWSRECACEHGRHVFGEIMSGIGRSDTIKRTAMAILAHGPGSITRGRLQESCYSFRAARQQQEAILRVLVDSGWLRSAGRVDALTRRPRRYDINPLVFDRFSAAGAAETVRRAESASRSNLPKMRRVIGRN